jgi:hypothetical protein
MLIVFRVRQVDDSAWIKRLRALKVLHKSFLVFSGGLPLEALAERITRLDIRNPRRIHFANTASIEDEKQLAERLLLALGSEAPSERVIDAWPEGDCFVVISPKFQRIHVPLSRLRPLAALSRRALNSFEIDDEGAFVHWPGPDIHLGWQQFVQTADEETFLAARQKTAGFNRRYGAAMRGFREQAGLRQADISGLSARQAGRIERGECRATHAALEKYAEAHDLSVSQYMEKIAGQL